MLLKTTISIVFLCFGITPTFAEQNLETTETASIVVNTYTIKRIATKSNVSIAGTVVANKTAQLTAQIPGRVLSIRGKEGEQFSKGSWLIKIDDSAVKAKLDAAYAQREAALASIRNAQMQYHREVNSPRSSSTSAAPGGMGMPSMMDQMFFSQMQNSMGMRNQELERTSDIVSRQTQIANANTQLKQADAGIKEIQSSIRDAISVAPFNGVIEKVFVEEGDTVQPGMPLVKISETSDYKIEANIPVRLVNNLHEKMDINVKLDNIDTPIIATISRIYPVANSMDHTVMIEITLPKDIKVTAGMYAEVKLPEKEIGNTQSLQLLIPDSAVVMKNGLSLVHHIDNDGTSRLRIIRLGKKLGNGFSVLLSGLSEGAEVITNPPPGLKSGTKVAPTAQQ